LNIVLDSLKFYKLKNENTARILFLIVYALFLGFYIFPIGVPVDVEAIATMLMDNTAAKISVLSGANILNFISQIVLILLTACFSLLYANCYVMQSEGFPNKKAILSAIRSIPKLFGFLIVMLLPVVISSLFAFIPLIYLFYALFFSPMMIIEGKKGIIESIRESYKATKGIKLSIFISQMLLYFLMNLPITLFSTAFFYIGNNDTLAEYLVMSFLRAAYVLMGGRLIGNFYILAIKNPEKIRNGRVDILQKFTGTNETQDDTDGTDGTDDADDADDTENTDDTGK